MTDNTHPCDYAFPVAPGDVPYWQPGMTLRDYFAGQALASMSPQRVVSPTEAKDMATSAYKIANAMFEERNK